MGRACLDGVDCWPSLPDSLAYTHTLTNTDAPKLNQSHTLRHMCEHTHPHNTYRVFQSIGCTQVPTPNLPAFSSMCRGGWGSMSPSTPTRSMLLCIYPAMEAGWVAPLVPCLRFPLRFGCGSKAFVTQSDVPSFPHFSSLLSFTLDHQHCF